jgi:hypothetical protein
MGNKNRERLRINSNLLERNGETLQFIRIDQLAIMPQEQLVTLLRRYH